MNHKITFLVVREELKPVECSIKNELQAYIVKFILENELFTVKKKFLHLQKKGIVKTTNNVSKSYDKRFKKKVSWLIISRKSLKKALENTEKLIYGN